MRFGFPESWRAKSDYSSPLLTQGLVVSGSLTTRPQGWHPAERRKRPFGRAFYMNPSTVDALANFEQWLADALRDVQRARLEFEARLATALAEERIEPENKRAQADQLAEEVAEIARKFADEAAKVARKRVPPLRPPQTSVRPRGPVRRSWWPFRRAG